MAASWRNLTFSSSFEPGFSVLIASCFIVPEIDHIALQTSPNWPEPSWDEILSPAKKSWISYMLLGFFLEFTLFGFLESLCISLRRVVYKGQRLSRLEPSRLYLHQKTSTYGTSTSNSKYYIKYIGSYAILSSYPWFLHDIMSFPRCPLLLQSSVKCSDSNN